MTNLTVLGDTFLILATDILCIRNGLFPGNIYNRWAQEVPQRGSVSDVPHWFLIYNNSFGCTRINCWRLRRHGDRSVERATPSQPSRISVLSLYEISSKVSVIHSSRHVETESNVHPAIKISCQAWKNIKYVHVIDLINTLE